MFKSIFKIPHLIRLFKMTTALSLITYQKYHCTNNVIPKLINEKDLNAALTNPEYFTNTIIILNKNIIDQIPRTLQVKFCQYNGEFNEYDLIAINQHRCLLLKIRSEEDYLKLLNFFTPISTLSSRQQAIDLIDKMDAKVILSYVPQQVIGKQAEEQINKFDTFKQKNYKDLEYLEEQFRELRYIDINRDAQYYLIRDKAVAEQFNMSANDIGEVYVLKATSIFTAKESSFFQDGKEYTMNKIEPDPNIENADHFRLSKKSQSLSNILAESKEYSINKLNLQKFVQRLSLVANNYVNYIYNKQQMDSQLLLYKQLGVKYLLIYYTENDVKEKVIKKLINVKKSLTTEQQQQFAIIYSDNVQLLQSYFGLVSNEITDEVRLLDLESPQQSCQFKTVQLGQPQETINKYSTCKRYVFNDKFTTNRLRQFVVSTTNLQIANFKPEKKEEYYEKLFLRVPLENIQTITSNSLKLSGFDLLYFYKPGCAACLNLSETLEKISQRLLQPNPFRVKNPANFKNIQIKKYNILNENQLLPSPTQAPLIVALKNGEIKQADLLQNKINPGDEEKVLHFLTKFIDSL